MTFPIQKIPIDIFRDTDTHRQEANQNKLFSSPVSKEMHVFANYIFGVVRSRINVEKC